MNLQEILTAGGGALLVVLTLVQIAPVKINPWTWIAQAIGRAINHEVLEKVDNLADDVKRLKATCDEREATARRTQILHFGDEILHGVEHTKEHFDQILLDCTYYENFCAEHPFYANDVANQTIDLIKRTYRTCMEEKNFL